MRGLVLEGRVLTRDTAHPEDHSAHDCGKGGAYVLIAKGNQPLLRKKIAEVLAGGSLFEVELRQASPDEQKRGRTEEREVTVVVSGRADLPVYLGFAGAARGFRL